MYDATTCCKMGVGILSGDYSTSYNYDSFSLVPGPTPSFACSTVKWEAGRGTGNEAMIPLRYKYEQTNQLG